MISHVPVDIDLLAISAIARDIRDVVTAIDHLDPRNDGLEDIGHHRVADIVALRSNLSARVCR
jgi:hypothetical protein